MASKKKYKKMSAKKLEELVRHHNYLYFVKKEPEISDYEFDRIVEALKEKKPNSEILKEIGSDIEDEALKVKHDPKMLSLDKAYESEEMENWSSKFEGKIIASPKVDGCAVAIRYDENGELYLSATRGNGIEGEEITKNIKEIKAIPNKIKAGNIEVRGEVYMPLSVFEKFSDKFANPRNLSAGAIKQKDPKKTAEYNLSFWAYDIRGTGLSEESEKLKKLEELKFPTVEWKIIDKSKIEEAYDEFFTRRNKYDFETDGVVYKVNNISEQERLGMTAHHPRYAIAYKYQGDSGETILKDVEWSVSRTGLITPVGVVEPVELSGAKVTRASLHNYGLMKKMHLTKDAKVLMMRRGGVIPKLEKVIGDGKEEFRAPKRCPSCGSPTKINDDFLYCTNPGGCIKMKLAELEHFINAIECDGFGPKIIEQLQANQMVTDPSDFYKITVDELMQLDRMGDKLANKLIRNINNKRRLPLDIFLKALGIRDLGSHVATILAEKYGSIDRILKVEKEELASIHSIGDIIAEHVVEGLKEKRELIDKLREEIDIQKVETHVGEGLLSDKKFLFTGSMKEMDRGEAKRKVKEKGGRPVSSISKETDYLVVGSKGGAGLKLDKAKKLQDAGEDIKIISEDEFLKMIGK